MRALLGTALVAAFSACVAPDDGPLDAGPPDLSLFTQVVDQPLFREPGNNFLKRWLVCGDGFMAWNNIGFVEIAEPHAEFGGIVVAQIPDVTLRVSESGFKWAQLSGTTLYLGDVVDDVHVYDLTDHSHPTMIGSFSGYAQAPTVVGSRLIYAGVSTRKGDGYQVIDATDVAHPVYGEAHLLRAAVTGFTPQGSAGFTRAQDRLFAWDSTGTALFEMDQTAPMFPKATSVVATGVSALGGAVFGQYFIANTFHQGWKIIDVHEPGNAVMLIDAMDFTNAPERTMVASRELPLVRGGLLVRRGWVNFQDENNSSIGGHFNPITRYTLGRDGTPVEHSKLPLPEWPAIGNMNPTTVDDVCWDGRTLTVVGDRITYWRQAAPKKQ